MSADHCPKCRYWQYVSVVLTTDSYIHYRCGTCQIEWVKAREDKKQMYIIVRDPSDTKYPEFSTMRRLYSLDQAIEAVKGLAIKYPGSKFFIAHLIKSAITEPNVKLEDC